ncbi:MAG TPA: DUF881 domain-containing protein [Nocardioidaceae bacterium]|nr:DUF881 domain-containing protein [Nocardioidaceae bacterium]
MNETQHRRSSSQERETWKQRVEAALARRARTRGNRSWSWRLLAPVVFLAAGALFITSGVNADGTDLRAGRYTDLGSVVAQQKKETDQRRAEVAALSDEVNRLSAQKGDTSAQTAQDTADALRGPAGLVPVKGPGLSVTLDDAPEDVDVPPEIGVNDLVVHQQDIQAVVNAMWAGGAEAMTIQDQRVISTTGIKCIGNTVQLHGVPYAPPYVITAVGDPDAMLTSINESPYIEIYKQYVEKAQLGYDVEAHTEVELPGYEGSLDLSYARPAGEGASRPDDNDI